MLEVFSFLSNITDFLLKNFLESQFLYSFILTFLSTDITLITIGTLLNSSLIVWVVPFVILIIFVIEVLIYFLTSYLKNKLGKDALLKTNFFSYIKRKSDLPDIDNFDNKLLLLLLAKFLPGTKITFFIILTIFDFNKKDFFRNIMLVDILEAVVYISLGLVASFGLIENQSIFIFIYIIVIFVSVSLIIKIFKKKILKIIFKNEEQKKIKSDD